MNYNQTKKTTEIWSRTLHFEVRKAEENCNVLVLRGTVEQDQAKTLRNILLKTYPESCYSIEFWAEKTVVEKFFFT